MSGDKYPSIFSRQMEAIVYLTRHGVGVKFIILCTEISRSNNIIFLFFCFKIGCFRAKPS